MAMRTSIGGLATTHTMTTVSKIALVIGLAAGLAMGPAACRSSGDASPRPDASPSSSGVGAASAPARAATPEERVAPAPVHRAEATPPTFDAHDDAVTVMTADIQAGIERHIAEATAANGGYYPLAFNGTPMRLKLVRVHTEYLANLGPKRHFACVDLANIDGNVYDVDFFLAGDPGSMAVTETTVHKLNGVPYYLWEQADDGSWFRTPASEGTDELMGVVRGRDTFEFRYDATLPALSGPARAWAPIPRSDAFQRVEVVRIDAPGSHRTHTDNHGNTILVMDLGPADAGKAISMRFRVERVESGPYADASSDPRRHLGAELLVPDAPEFREAAAGATRGKDGDLVRARAIYDHTIETFKYMRYGTGWGKGDALRACDARSGNCTDFHAYFIGVARAAGIPARFAIGASIPSDRDEGGVDGYHCWAEFFAEGKWWPVDLSEANKYSALSTYYFGHQPANRLELSRGRDLDLGRANRPASGPINFLAYPLLETDGKTATVPTKFSFRRLAR